MISRQGVTVSGRLLSGSVVVILALLTLYPACSDARNELVFAAGISEPMGDTANFAASGNIFELRWRHWNRGNSAYEIVGGYSEHSLAGEVQSTIANFEALVRSKNELGQLQGTSPGRGRLVAEYGVLETYYLNANIMYRFFKRSRISPTVSIGGGAYRWSLPFRVKFFDVPSFGEQQPWLPVGDPNDSRVYAYDFGEVVLDYTKIEISGGLNAAAGLDVRLTRHWNLGGEARAHLLFSSGQGSPEEGSDDQPYLDNMSFLYIQGSINYRF